VPVFSPNGDGYGDTIAFAVGASEPGRVVGTVLDDNNREVDRTAVSVGSAKASLTWDGRDASGNTAADGTYTVVFEAEDRAGNRSDPQTRTVAIYGSLSRLRMSTSLFYPQDRDSLAGRVGISFSLARAATVTWTIVNAAGTTVRTIMTGQPLAAGPRTGSWNGRNDAGAFVPRGRYTVVVSATNGNQGATLRASAIADAFRIVASDTTPARGQRITVTITTAESLKAAPRMTIFQPGISAWTVATTRVSTGVYRVTIRLKSSSVGTLRLKAFGTDSGGRSQHSSLYIRLH
jgi:flagellar hook assembly protein FlgD